MIRVIFLIFCLNMSISAISQTNNATIGEGRLQVSLNAPIPLYTTFEDSLAFDTISFEVISEGASNGKFKMNYKNVNLAPLKFYGGDSNKESLSHISMGLVYFAPNLTFRVLESKENSYKIVLNEETFETAIVKLGERVLYTKGKFYWAMGHNSSESDDKWFLYETWGVYMKRLMYISTNKIKIYNQPEGKVVKKLDSGSFGCDSIDGYWIRVSLNKSKTENLGWIKWTDGKIPLVKFVEEVYF